MLVYQMLYYKIYHSIYVYVYEHVMTTTNIAPRLQDMQPLRIIVNKPTINITQVCVSTAFCGIYPATDRPFVPS